MSALRSSRSKMIILAVLWGLPGISSCVTSPGSEQIVDYTLTTVNASPLPFPLYDPGTRDGQPTGCFIAVLGGDLHLDQEQTFQYSLAYGDTCGTHPGWASSGGLFGHYSVAGTTLQLHASISGFDTVFTGSKVADTVFVNGSSSLRLKFVRN